MIIKKMTATFGGLEQARLELSDGLNIIYAPNEAGKSTWCGFLRAMLFGISTRERDKKGFIAEKNRYQPWSGAPMEGEVQLVWQGRDITLRRFTKGTTPFGGFSAVYTDTQEPVPALTAQNCGEVLLGVSREVWERSAFIGSAPTLAIDGTPELERRIAAMFSSGQEDVSFSQAQDRLKEWLRRRQHNRSGMVPRLETELAQTDELLSRMDGAQQRMTSARQERQRLEAYRDELTGLLQLHQRLDRHELNTRYAQACAEDDAAQRALSTLLRRQQEMGQLPARAELLQAQDDLRYLNAMDEELAHARTEAEQARCSAENARAQAADPLFDSMTAEQARRRALQDRDRAAELSSRLQRTRSLPPLGIALALALSVTGAVAGDLVHAMLPCLSVGLVLAAAAAVSTFVWAGRCRSRLAPERNDLLARYGATLPEQIPDRAEDYCSRLRLAEQEEASFLRLDQALVQRLSRRASVWETLCRLVHRFDPNASDLPACRQALTRALELEGELEACRSRAQLTARHREDLRTQGGQLTNTLEQLTRPPMPAEEIALRLAETAASLSAAESQLAMAQGELLTLGDRTELEARRTLLLNQLLRRREEYRAIEVALHALEQANARLQERFAPELNRLAGEILSRLTAGRYRALFLNREFDASAQNNQGLMPRSWHALSRGTADQVYLAVRLAVCRLCLPNEDPSPLVLDDALITFDEERMALAVEHLADTDRQVILFSCQQRESRLGLGRIQPLHS